MAKRFAEHDRLDLTKTNDEVLAEWEKNDIFHKSNIHNMSLIKGFVEGDETIIKTVNRKAAWSVVIFICLCILIYLMFRLLFWLGEQVVSFF